jgi:hypothetical protein
MYANAYKNFRDVWYIPASLSENIMLAGEAEC